MVNPTFQDIYKLYLDKELPDFLSRALYKSESKVHNGIFKELIITYSKREYIESPTTNVYVKFYNHHFVISNYSSNWCENIILCEKYNKYNNVDDLFLEITNSLNNM